MRALAQGVRAEMRRFHQYGARLLWLVLMLAATRTTAGTASALLEHLSVDALPAQAPRIITLALQAHGLDQLPPAEQDALRTAVLEAFTAMDLPRRWEQVLSTLPDPVVEDALRRLETEAVQQLQEAALAPADAEQWQALRRYRAGLQGRPPRSDRTALMVRIVDAQRYADWVALLQTGIEQLLLQHASAMGASLHLPADSEWPWLLAQRQQHHHNAQVEYSFYSYRFLSNNVLKAYLAEVEDGPVAQVHDALLAATREAFADLGL